MYVSRDKPHGQRILAHLRRDGEVWTDLYTTTRPRRVMGRARLVPYEPGAGGLVVVVLGNNRLAVVEWSPGSRKANWEGRRVWLDAYGGGCVAKVAEWHTKDMRTKV